MKEIMGRFIQTIYKGKLYPSGVKFVDLPEKWPPVSSVYVER
jgi:hypothetical protein